MDIDERVRQIQNDQLQIRLNFVRAEIDLGFTFCQSARLSIESDHRQHASQALTNARKALQGAIGGVGQLGGAWPADLANISEQLEQLRAAVASLEGLSRPSSAD